MGAWGVKALESDAGLDVVDFLEDFYKGKTALSLSEIISTFIEQGLLSADRNNIEFYFDNTAMALAELYLMFQKKGELDYDNEEEALSLRNKKEFTSDEKSLGFIEQQLVDIQNEKPDEDGEREYVVIWRDSSSYEEWKVHLDSLIIELKNELKIGK